jgi:hypothetical protein
VLKIPRFHLQNYNKTFLYSIRFSNNSQNQNLNIHNYQSFHKMCGICSQQRFDSSERSKWITRSTTLHEHQHISSTSATRIARNSTDYLTNVSTTIFKPHSTLSKHANWWISHQPTSTDKFERHFLPSKLRNIATR